MINPKLIDAHTHTHFAAFENDQDAVIKRALNAGIWLINVGTQKDTSKKAILITEKYQEGVYATVGLHPIHTEKSYHDPQELGGESVSGFTSRREEFDASYYEELAQHPKVVAIGECGLDYYRISDHQSKKIQEKNFIAQIELAVKVAKPLMLHCRPSKNDDAYNDLLAILKSYALKLQPSVIHFFVGSVNTAQKFLDSGFYFTFGGVITFARDYDEVIKKIPLDRILVETDAPYVTPIPYRGKRNEPLYVEEAAKKIAEIKRLSFGEVAQRTIENTRRVFFI